MRSITAKLQGLQIISGGGGRGEVHDALLLSSHGARGSRTRRIQLQPRLQFLPLLCACGHALGLSLPCASRAESFI